VAHISRSYAYRPLLYLAALALSFASPLAGLALNFLMAVCFALPHRQFRSLMDEQAGQP